jgi:hypothetical protein
MQYKGRASIYNAWRVMPSHLTFKMEAAERIRQVAAHAVVHQLHERLAPDCLPVFTSDGLNLYFYTLTAHFGQWVERVGRRTRQWQLAAGLLYGQVKKRLVCKKEMSIIYRFTSE